MTWAVVPVKRFALGKSRLGPVLGERERERFAKALFDHALETIVEAGGLEGVLVVTECAEVAARARTARAEAVLNGADASIGEAVRVGLAEVGERGGRGALVVMSDLPLLDVSDVDALLRALAAHDVVLAPDTRDVGTNALALASPRAMKTLFGTGDSYPRHLAEAARAALRVGTVRTAGLAFDVDTPDDYWRFLELSACAGAQHEPLS